MKAEEHFIGGTSVEGLRAMLEAALGRALGLEIDPAGAGRRRRLDTFDRRLTRAGAVLEGVEHAQTIELVLRERGASPHEGAATAWPRFPADLSSSVLSGRLAALTRRRAVLPVAEVAGRLARGRIRDREGKTRVRVELWQHRRGQAVLRLRAVRGYRPVLGKLRERLRGLGAEPVEDPLQVEAARAGPPAGAPEPIGLEKRADSACKDFLRRQLQIMSATEQGVVDKVDTEFLHDFRVAVRRGRSLLREAQGVLPASAHRHAADELAWLGQVTGPARDLDVQLEELEDQRGWIPARLRAGLDSYAAELARRRHAADACLIEALGSPRYRRFVKRWGRYLAAPVPARPGAPHAREPVAVLAGKRLRRLHRRLVAEGRAIDDASPDQDLHALRKTAKRLRYLLEFIATLGTRDAGPLIKRLRELQENLGTFQDLCVERELLLDFAVSLGAGRPERASIDRLHEAVIDRARIARADFAGRFERFTAKPTRRRFEALAAALVATGKRARAKGG